MAEKFARAKSFDRLHFNILGVLVGHEARGAVGHMAETFARAESFVHASRSADELR